MTRALRMISPLVMHADTTCFLLRIWAKTFKLRIPTRDSLKTNKHNMSNKFLSCVEGPSKRRIQVHYCQHFFNLHSALFWTLARKKLAVQTTATNLEPGRFDSSFYFYGLLLCWWTLCLHYEYHTRTRFFSFEISLLVMTPLITKRYVDPPFWPGATASCKGPRLGYRGRRNRKKNLKVVYRIQGE